MIKHKRIKTINSFAFWSFELDQNPNKVDAINAKCSALQTHASPLCKICKDIVDDYLYLSILFVCFRVCYYIILNFINTVMCNLSFMCNVYWAVPIYFNGFKHKGILKSNLLNPISSKTEYFNIGAKLKLCKRWRTHRHI